MLEGSHWTICTTRYPLLNGCDVGLGLVQFIPLVFVGVTLINCGRLQLRLWSLLLKFLERWSLLRVGRKIVSQLILWEPRPCLWTIFSWHSLLCCLQLVANAAGVIFYYFWFYFVNYSLNRKEKIWLTTLSIPKNTTILCAERNHICS